jgi:hypothetical protein
MHGSFSQLIMTLKSSFTYLSIPVVYLKTLSVAETVYRQMAG